MKAWAASLALHGAALGAASLLWLEPQVEPQASPLRWTVSFAPAPPAPPAAPVAPTPPQRNARHEPAPSPVVPQRAVEAVATPPAAPAQAPQLPVVTPAVPASVSVATAVPVTPPASVVDTAAEIEHRWYLALMERLSAMKRYPMVARRLGQEGVVLVEADIGRDGRLLGVALKRGSGYPLLDNDALRLIEAAAEAARSQLTPERPTRLQIPVAYKLES